MCLSAFLLTAVLLCLLPQYPSENIQSPLSHFIHKYDTLSYTSQKIVRKKRSSNFNSRVNVKSIKFVAFGRHFHLELESDNNIFGPDAYLEMGNKKYPIDKSMAVRGKLNNHKNSLVYGSVINGVFRGTIAPSGLDHSDGAFHVEAAGYYFNTSQDFHSVIYHDNQTTLQSDREEHKTGARLRRDVRPSHICGWEDPEIARTMHEMTPKSRGSHAPINYSSQEIPFTSYFAKHMSSGTTGGGKRTRRSPNSNDNYSSRVCNLFLQSDTFLWDRVLRLQHIDNDKDLAKQEITSIFTQHVQGAMAIYQHAILQNFAKTINYKGVSFRVDRIRINTTDDCLPGVSNPFCSANIDVTNFLNLNSYVNHNDFCLAYVFTYRDFSGGTLGLAWVAEPGGSGGICERFRMMREGSQDIQKSLNTGIVTLLNYGSHVALKVSQLTFAHEMGHNFGSKHDDDHKDHGECVPNEDNPRGNYIMFASATSGDKDNNNQFSSCSRDSIARLVDQVFKSSDNCFKKTDGPFCGNKLKEEGEQCDCGFEDADCTDRCCNPKSSKTKACMLTDNILIGGSRHKVECSPSAGECCTVLCKNRSSDHLCRAAGECYKAANCSGNDAKCPPSEQLENGTSCQEHTRVCKGGECIGSICERIPGWHECSLKRGDKISDTMMCYVACKENKTDSPCISTHELEKDKNLREKYPKLTAELLRNGKGIQLKAGAPCDNYRGYCDVFSRCRSVDADGPLARLRNLIFNPQMLNKIKTWITKYWWGVILIALGVIAFMIIFVKVCAVHTPSSNPNRPRVGHKSAPRPTTSSELPHQHHPPPSRATRSAANRNSIIQQPHNNDHEMVSVAVRSGGGGPGPNSIAASIGPPLTPSAPNYPPPAYNDILTQYDEASEELLPPARSEVIHPPIQHGKGKGKKGHLQALNQQASKYKL